MITSIFRNLITASAGPAMAVRVGIVGLNFGVMIGLAAWLGLDMLGRLIVIWGLAMIGSSIVSWGAPLMLLRSLNDGGRIAWQALLRYAVIGPVLVGLLGIAILPLILPALPWVAITSAALAIHLASCLASIMRALGSLHWSMILRDAAPQLALGFAAIFVIEDSADILLLSALLLLVVCQCAAFWCWRQPGVRALLCDGFAERPPLSLWGTSVLGTALAQVDIVIGGAFLSDAQIGLYGLLRRLTNLVVMPVSVATWVSSVPVAKAHGADDIPALRSASRQASLIAVVPGVGLLITALAALTVNQLLGLRVWDAEGDIVCLILLGGAVMQLLFAATFTVATLCKLAYFTVIARLCSVVAYLGAVVMTPTLTPVLNASIYIAALTCGHLLLWTVVQRRLGVDTSAWALLRRGQEVRWKMS